MKLILSILLCLFVGQAQAEANLLGSWYDRSAYTDVDRNYLWYPDPVASSPSPEAKPTPPSKPADNRPEELKAFEALQKITEDAKKVAIMNPTEDNVANYIMLQDLMMTKASNFTDQWQRTLLARPELNYALRSGNLTNANGLAITQANKEKQTGQSIQSLAKEKGIFFFFRGDCTFCHAMAPILKSFAMRYGITVKAISLDGLGIKEFPNAVADNGIGERLSIQTVPAIFGVKPKTGEYIPLAYGVVSEEELGTRFVMQDSAIGTQY